jgi:hypothetical protein
VRNAPVHVGIGIIWVKADRLVEVFEGSVQVAFVIVRNAPVNIGSGIIRIKADRPCVTVDLFINIFCFVSLFKPFLGGQFFFLYKRGACRVPLLGTFASGVLPYVEHS